MASSYPITKPSLLLFSLSLLLLSLPNTVLGAGHHKRKHAQAPAPSLVVATPPAPVESTPALVQAPSSASDLAPAEGPTQDCSQYATGLLECLDYLQAGSSSAKPEGSCCIDLRSIAQEDVSCLCALLTSDQKDLGFPVNTSRIMSLPYTCSFTLPTSSECKGKLFLDFFFQTPFFSQFYIAISAFNNNF
jgi:Probable lipid transfer